MINKTTIEESTIGNLAQVQNNVMTNMRCHTFAKVKAVYKDGINEQQTDKNGNTYNIKRAKNTIDVEPIVKEYRQKYNINNKLIILFQKYIIYLILQVGNQKSGIIVYYYI